ncbi:fungal-specific transcription factor domain-containing protein [Russula vinacea]|nr:fungal-specific transcription factor domain-containing protein [Russula vinacea]
MIGATPTFFDPDRQAQPQAHDYHDWTTASFAQPQLALSTSSTFPHQHSTADPRPETQAQPTNRHRDQYQFVNQPPPSTSSDAAHYPYFFDPSNSLSQAIPPQGCDPYLTNLLTQQASQYSASYDTTQTQHQHQTQPTDPVAPRLTVTPVSDTTLPSASRISPASTNNALPSPGRSSNTSMRTVIVHPKRVGKSAPTKPVRKRQKPETDEDEEEDVLSASLDTSVSRPNPNRLPGACTYCKRLKMKCYFPPGENVCKRCRQGKHDCIVEGRKPRSAPNKREYLLAQLRQKDELIDSLLKQLHNPYLATPLSIEQYRNATSSNDKHRQNVIAWLDRLQSSVRSAPARSGSAANPFQLDTRAGKGGGQSDESDEEHASQRPVQARPASSGSGDTPLSPNTLVESDVDPYPDDAVPIGLLASLAISTSRDASGVAAEKTRKENATRTMTMWCGVANKTFFMPGPAMNLGLRKSLIDKTRPPDILVHKLVTPDDPFITVLEPKLHTPALTFSRCPFLFTVVCAIALRYSEKREVYPIAMHFAKSAAANALIDGWKSVELCQAYILLSIYSVPARRWEEDRSWLYTGLAIRIATDLNLHLLPPKKPTTEQQELEMLNRTRIWIICYNLDKSTATQFGKPSTLREDHIVRNSTEWYKSSPFNNSYDVHIIAYTSLFRIVNKFHQEVFSDPNVPNGLNCSIDFRAVTLVHDRMLADYRQEWADRFEQDSDHTNAACEFRVKLLPFYTNYARLVMFSFGFQKAFQRGFEDDDEIFFTKSLESAKNVVTVLIDSLVPTGYIRFAPDGYFVFAAFASAFMLKLLRPECSRFITQGLEAEIYRVIDRLINTIGSPQISIDERHTPKLYSRFLASLLAKHKRDGAAHGRMHQQGPPTQQMQTGSNAPVYQQHPIQQPQPSHSTNSTHFATGVGGTSASDLPPSMVLNGGVMLPTGSMEMGNSDSPGNYTFDSPDFAFGGTEQHSDLMDFTFDPITTPGNDDLLAAMQAIQSPTWFGSMLMPGFQWPAEESIQDHSGGVGNNAMVNNYQNFHAQPTEVLLH